MLVLLPLIAFFICFLVLKLAYPGEDWRRIVLRTAIIWGIYAVGTVEILSLIRGISPLGLSITWIVPSLVGLLWLIRRREIFHGFDLPSWFRKQDRIYLGFYFGILIILLLTAIVAWRTPPQTWDSLNYHMSRVAHWTQMQAVRHYPTGIEVQNNMPPGAEFLVLHTYVLSQGDKWVNFIQWFAMLGSLVGVAWITHQLGMNRFGQLIATVFAATIPMGIVQASSTMTDYVEAFWMICVASESIAIWKSERWKAEAIFVSLAAGLAMLTKPTAYAFLLPFALLVAWSLFKRLGFWYSLRLGFMAILLVSMVVGGHFVRNYDLYDHPIGPPDRFDQHANQLLTLRGLISNFIRNVSLHIRTPSPHVNKAFALTIQWIHDMLGLDENDPRTTAAGKFKISQPSTHEILTGNPLHALLILSVVIGLIGWRRKFNPSLAIYIGLVLSAFILFSLFYKWLIFGSRLQLPLFLLFAPVVGLLGETDRLSRIGACVGGILLVASLPWLLSIETRPILPIEDRSPVESVLTESRLDLLFSTGSYLIEPSRDMVVRIEEAGCNEVGLMLAGNGVEYPFWYMLEAPRQDLHMEWIVEGTYSAKLADPDFSPCAAICEKCQIQSEVFRGLPQVLERAPYRLYLIKTDQ